MNTSIQRRAALAVAMVAALAAGGEARGQVAAADSAASAPSVPARRAAWTSDGRNFAPGDAITVLVDERVLATADRANAASAGRGSEADVAVSQSVVRTGPLSAGVAGGFGSGRRVDSSDRGEQYRRNSFRGEVAARVVAVEPGGVLRIEGKKRIQVDKSWQELTLTGWVRAGDVADGRMVDSWRVGDLALAYASRGDFGKPKQSLISRILGMFWP